MHIHIKAACIALAAISMFSGSANADLLQGEEIENTIGGKRVNLEVRFGIEFPMYYKADGRVTGDGSGTGLGKYFAPKETGSWWVSGDRICQQFPTWYEGRQLCFQLRKTGPDQLEWIREDGRSGVARIVG